MDHHLRILLVDGDEIWRRGFREIVDDQHGWELCGEVVDVSPRALLALDVDGPPDVVAIDADLAADAVDQIRRRWPDSGILAFGSHEHHQVVRALFRAGVQALIASGDPLESLREAIAAVARGHKFLSPRAAEIVLDRYLSESASDERPSRPLRCLTSRENDVVRLLASGYNNREIAAALGISAKTVENHRANAMRKLGSRSVADLVRAALREGVIEGE